MFGRDEVDPPRRDPPSVGSSSQGSSSQPPPRTTWQVRPGQGIPTRGIDSRDTAYRRTLHFGMTKVPKLTRATLVNTEVHLFIQYIHRLLSHEAFDESVMGNMIDTETISLLQFLFYPTETHRRHPISNHWTIDWDVATIIEALEELYPLQAEHKHLDLDSRWQQVIDRSISRIRIEADNMAQVQRDTIQEWNNGSTTIGPIPHSMNTRVLTALVHSFTHRDNPSGNRNSNIAFQRMNQEQQQQHCALRTTLLNSLNRTTHQRVTRSRVLSCWLTGRSRVCRKYAGHVRERRSGPTTT